MWGLNITEQPMGQKRNKRAKNIWRQMKMETLLFKIFGTQQKLF